MQIWNTIKEQIQSIGGNTISTMYGWVIIIWSYIVVIAILVYIHNKLLKRHKRIHKNLVEMYDTLRYQIAKAQYENPAIQNNKGIKITIEADHKNYPANAAEIKQEILSIEQQWGKEIISKEQRDKINSQTKKKNILMLSTQILGRIITILTIGIYKIFW